MVSVDTPCTNVCTIDPVSGLCIGCGRTLSEIAGWLTLSAAERRRIMTELPQRMVRPDASRLAKADVG
jgi:predicted Fe-S protein YdhL (DUF1289 family)